MFTVSGLADPPSESRKYRKIATRWISPGSTIRIEATVRNEGRNSSDSFTIKFYASKNSTITKRDVYLGELRAPELEPEKGFDIKWGGRVPELWEPGDYWIGWIIVPEDGIEELDESIHEVIVDGARLKVSFLNRRARETADWEGGLPFYPGVPFDRRLE